MASTFPPNSIDIRTQIITTDPVFRNLLHYDIPSMIAVAVQILLIFGIVAAFIFLIIGSVQWVTAGGDKDGIEKARKKITGAIIGLAIGLSIFVVLRLINVIFGLNILGDIVIPSI